MPAFLSSHQEHFKPDSLTHSINTVDDLYQRVGTECTMEYL